MMWSERKGNEIYVYRNGVLIYKKWVKENNSVIFNNYGHPSWKHDSYITIK